MNRKKSQGRFVFAWLHAILLILLFIFVPTVKVFTMALWDMVVIIIIKKNLLCFANFAKLMQNTKLFSTAMHNTILVIVLVMIFTIVLAVLFAALLSRGDFRGKNFFRVIFEIPHILSIVVVAGIFGAIYNPSSGLLNTFLEAIHLDGLVHQWMGEPKFVLYSVVFDY